MEIKPGKFLEELMATKAPTGCEYQATAAIDAFAKPFADEYSRDVLGNRFASVGSAQKTIMFAGHIDEIGLIISHIDDKGFLFFQQLGGHDNIMLSGRRVAILAKKGVVRGVTGKKAVHLMDAKERKEVPETHQIWIDIGASSKEEAQALVEIGDSAVFECGLERLSKNRYAARAFDDKAGAYCAFEALRRIKEKGGNPDFKITAVATSQEEIGTRGAWTASYSVNPQIGIAIDVEHATDFPGCDARKNGLIKLGAGVVISRGPNINPVVFDRLVECAKANNIPYQVNAEPRPTGTDARILQMTRRGVATGLLGIPLRYMHTPAETADLQDIESCAALLAAFALSVKNDDDFTF
ncbi:MAG: M42 family metallopeptidase [Opitutales bacterium]|nr:M42 family metallopeptidase [Opitutales bacterium]